MTQYETLLSTGDATLRRYERTFDQVVLELEMWNNTTKIVTAFGVTKLIDLGTWEVDGIVRVRDLDDNELLGYGIVDTENNVTLRFAAKRIDL